MYMAGSNKIIGLAQIIPSKQYET